MCNHKLCKNITSSTFFGPIGANNTCNACESSDEMTESHLIVTDQSTAESDPRYSDWTIPLAEHGLRGAMLPWRRIAPARMMLDTARNVLPTNRAWLR